MGAEDEQQLTLQGRATAAAGAAMTSALLLAPLDVIKTRIQAQAMASNTAQQSCTTSAYQCSSTLYEQAASRALSAGTAAAAAFRRWGITEGPIRRTPYHAAWPTAAAAGGGQLGSCGCAAAATVELPAHSLWETAKTISAREGLPVLWRGTWASLLIAVPMVGIYMPLYDALLAQWNDRLGTMAPVAAGTAARTVAVFSVAPFELLRTRLQASAGKGISLRDTVSSVIFHHHHGSSGSSGSSSRQRPAQQQHWHRQQQRWQQPQALQVQQQQWQVGPVAVLRGVPRFWTGFSATLVRDVPFSALYWALVEPLRQAMLPVNSHWNPWPYGHYQQWQQQRQLRRQQQQQQVPLQQHHVHEFAEEHNSSSSSNSHSGSISSETAYSCSGGSDGGGSTPTAAASHADSRQRVQHTQLEILIANMVSGFIAGGIAAGVTTPFDVVKTRMQIAQPGSTSSKGSSGSRIWNILQDVYRKEGLEGLFTGVKPRAYRAAPACAIVISVYELLKAWLLHERVTLL